IGNALQKMRFAFIETAETVGAQGLHNAHVNVGIVMLHEGRAIKLNKLADSVEVMIKQLLAQSWLKIGLGIVQQRGNVILQRAFASALVIQKERAAVAQHHVAGLK